MPRLYRRTEAGCNAWHNQDAQVPLEYRRVLGLLAHDTDRRVLRAKLAWSEAALSHILEELEELGMVEPVAAELDFTGKLSIAQLKAAAQDSVQDEDLDFTGSLSFAELHAAQQKKTA
jgi:hypothetical protein